MNNESKVTDTGATQDAVKEAIEESKASSSSKAQVESENEDEEETASADTPAAGAATKKKKSKKKKIKDALTRSGKDEGSSGSTATSAQKDMAKAMGGLSKEQIQEILKMNPGLAQDLGVGSADPSKVADDFKKLSLEEILAGLASSGKNVKDMAGYKFWQTQPVPKLGDKAKIEKEGPIRETDLNLVRKEPYPMAEGYEWVTMDMMNDDELKEVFELLYGHYVEDDEAMFRFNYSKSFLKWALLSPGWRKEWHVGLRATVSRRLVAFISAIPVQLRVRKNILNASEVNFLVVHKKLRAKRLTPILIKEITRRCNLEGVFQAIYTAGVVLPTPLCDVGFSPLPKNSKPSYQVQKYKLPDHTATKGLRPMEAKDVDAVTDLLTRYLARFDMAPQFSKEEITHWMLHKKDEYEEQVIWSYVVEDPTSKKITDFFSFYCLESSVINNPKHNNVRAAYLFYYATETVFAPKSSKKDLKLRLNQLVNDALILAKKFKFDVFNALTLQDNCLFLEEQKFGGGDGQLHYYLYNYNANPIAGGVDQANRIDEGCSGVGVVML